jgi:hypothetical protein
MQVANFFNEFSRHPVLPRNTSFNWITHAFRAQMLRKVLFKECEMSPSTWHEQNLAGTDVHHRLAGDYIFSGITES